MPAANAKIGHVAESAAKMLSMSICLVRYSFGIIRLIIQPPTAPIRIRTAPAPRQLFSCGVVAGSPRGRPR